MAMCVPGKTPTLYQFLFNFLSVAIIRHSAWSHLKEKRSLFDLFFLSHFINEGRNSSRNVKQKPLKNADCCLSLVCSCLDSFFMLFRTICLGLLSPCWIGTMNQLITKIVTDRHACRPTTSRWICYKAFLS